MRLVLLSLLSTTVLCFASLKSHAVFPDQSRRRMKLRSALRHTEGCNLNVCFAIDGSLSISEEEFESQRNLTFDITSILIDFPVSYGAVQYAKRVKQVSPLTNDILSFLVNLKRMNQVRGPFTNIGRGIKVCSKQLRRQREDINTIILFTDGRANRGRDPIRVANRFRRKGGNLFVVGVGLRDKDVLLPLAGGDPSKVLDVEDFFDTLSATQSLADEFINTCGPISSTEIQDLPPIESPEAQV